MESSSNLDDTPSEFVYRPWQFYSTRWVSLLAGSVLLFLVLSDPGARLGRRQCHNALDPGPAAVNQSPRNGLIP